MASILDESAYGNISPEAQFFKKDSAYGRAIASYPTASRNCWRSLEPKAKNCLRRTWIRKMKSTGLPPCNTRFTGSGW